MEEFIHILIIYLLLLDMIKIMVLRMFIFIYFTDGRDVSPTSGIKYIEGFGKRNLKLLV